VRYPTSFGIDLTSSEAKPSVCLGLDSRSQLVYLGFLTKNRDIVALLNFYSPEVIAIDAPLSLPVGLCCLDKSYPCHPELPGKNRQCDQELRQQGIPCYPATKKTFIKDLIYRSSALKTMISRKVGWQSH